MCCRYWSKANSCCSREELFHLLDCSVVCSNLTSCVFHALCGEEHSDRNVQRDLKLAKNMSSLKLWLAFPLTHSFWEKKCYFLNDETARPEKYIRREEILGVPGWVYSGKCSESQLPLKIFFCFYFLKKASENTELVNTSHYEMFLFVNGGVFV